ncbi:hypothetical protein R3P38DRAFT_3234590 [Favolaschia claudopus]|uniref:Uncharacterized protein n=1 Tax=Favolaschia claudopus TaxID=2862362 RepID=A0AAV9ZFY1_9AGAR
MHLLSHLWLIILHQLLVCCSALSAHLRRICSHPRLILHRTPPADPLIAAYAFGQLSISRSPLIVVGRRPRRPLIRPLPSLSSADCGSSTVIRRPSSPITTHSLAIQSMWISDDSDVGCVSRLFELSTTTRRMINVMEIQDLLLVACHYLKASDSMCLAFPRPDDGLIPIPPALGTRDEIDDLVYAVHQLSVDHTDAPPILPSSALFNPLVTISHEAHQLLVVSRPTHSPAAALPLVGCSSLPAQAAHPPTPQARHLAPDARSLSSVSSPAPLPASQLSFRRPFSCPSCPSSTTHRLA